MDSETLILLVRLCIFIACVCVLNGILIIVGIMAVNYLSNILIVFLDGLHIEVTYGEEDKDTDA